MDRSLVRRATTIADDEVFTENPLFSYAFALISHGYARLFVFLSSIPSYLLPHQTETCSITNHNGKISEIHQTGAGSIEYLTENVVLNETAKTYQRYQKTQHLFIFSLHNNRYYHYLRIVLLYLFVIESYANI